MLRIGIITSQPDLVSSVVKTGLIGSVCARQLAEVRVISLRDFAIDHRGTIDDRPYGGGDGMILRPEPLAAAIKEFENRFVILPSARGQVWTAKNSLDFSRLSKTLVFVCGRFGGVDQRFVDRYVDLEVSLGDYIVSSGDFAALAWTDSIVRHLAGALGHAESAKRDSFSEAYGGMLEYPVYTRPRSFEGMEVPEVLLSGDGKEISRWQSDQIEEVTKRYRPELLK